MLGIPRRFSHFVYGFIQAGLTCAVAAAIASFPFLAGGTFVAHWLQSWLVAWITNVADCPVRRTRYSEPDAHLDAGRLTGRA